MLHYHPPFPFADHDILETNFFIWNYHKPEMRLGELTLEHEIAWAKSLGLTSATFFRLSIISCNNSILFL